MFNKVLRYFHTLRYLKPTQIYYQVFYRIKNRIPFFQKTQNKYASSTSERLLFSSFYLINASDKLLGIGNFKFLNIEHKFNDKVDWSLNKYGKLWNYNLQYFDYLLDENASDDYKKQIVDEVAEQIIAGKFNLEPYPVSLRLINWILYFSRSGYLSFSMDQAIKIQIGYLRKNIEYHIQANHLLENYVSLLTSSYFIRNQALFTFSSTHLLAQLNQQILADGGHYEGSPMYHQIVLSKLLIVFEIEKKQPFGSKQYLETLQGYIARMFNWLHNIYFSSGCMPLFNDSIGGVAPDAAALWNCRKHLGINSTTNRELGESGYRKFCLPTLELIMDVGNIAPAYQPSHTHSDMLSFCLQHKGKDIIVDPGISTYESNSKRHLERSTVFHNTVTINAESQSDVWASFRVGKRAALLIHEEGKTFVRASHNGYRTRYKTDHQRSLRLTEEAVIIRDEFVDKIGKPIHLVGECRFYFDHTLKPVQTAEKVDVPGVSFCFDNAQKIEILRYQQPLGFNLLVDASYLLITFQHFLVTKIIPA